MIEFITAHKGLVIVSIFWLYVYILCGYFIWQAIQHEYYE